MTFFFRKLPERKALRLAGACALACAVAGCSSSGNSSWSELYQTAKLSIKGGEHPTLFQQASSLPYASLGVKFGGNDEQMLILAQQTPSSRLWTSAARIVLVTRNGRIIRTAGLRYNLDSTNFVSRDPLTRPDERNGSADYITHIANFYDIDEFSVPIHCRLNSRGSSPVTILGKSIATDRLDEICSCPELDWSYTNSFWIGKDGFVWKSIQYVHPKIGPLQTEILRPPADAVLLQESARNQ